MPPDLLHKYLVFGVRTSARTPKGYEFPMYFIPVRSQKTKIFKEKFIRVIALFKTLRHHFSHFTTSFKFLRLIGQVTGT